MQSSLCLNCCGEVSKRGALTKFSINIIFVTADHGSLYGVNSLGAPLVCPFSVIIVDVP